MAQFLEMTCLMLILIQLRENRMKKGLFICFSYRNCARYGHTNHWVVARTDQAHHFYINLRQAANFGTAGRQKWLDNKAFLLT